MANEKYLLFRRLMDLVSDDYAVVDADMNNYAGDIDITGTDGWKTIRITVEFKEVEQDAEELE